MDARRFPFFALGLVTTCFGCVHTDVPATSPGEPVAVKIRKAPDLPKKQPLPSTCVALGDVRARTALDPKCPTADQERLRDEARRAYQQALDIDPNHLGALTALARLYVSMEDYERAIATYRRAIQGHPSDASLQHDLGMCYARRKDWDPALACLKRTVEMDPEKRLYSHSYGFCLARAGRFEESFTALAKSEGKPRAHYDLARMLEHMNQEELGKQHLLQALAEDPKFNEARDMLAALQAKPHEQAAAGTANQN
jgi:tetratricopeptide (TPR) repeat protein